MGRMKVIYAYLPIEITDERAFTRLSDLLKVIPDPFGPPEVLPWSEDNVILTAMLMGALPRHPLMDHLGDDGPGFAIRSATPLPHELIAESFREDDPTPESGGD
jgi:hypothetical protein